MSLIAAFISFEILLQKNFAVDDKNIYNVVQVFHGQKNGSCSVTFYSKKESLLRILR